MTMETAQNDNRAESVMFKFFLILSAVIFFALAVGFFSAGLFDFAKPYFSAQIESPDKQTFTSPVFESKNLTTTPEFTSDVSIIFTGDVMLSRGVARKTKENNDPNYPFLKIRDYLKTADIVFGNLETALTQGREIGPGEMVFRADPELAFALRRVGFSVMSLANNHTMNFGQAGIKETFLNLLEAGVDYCGAGENKEEAYSPVFISKKGINFAFLAFTDSDVIPASYQAGASTAGVAFMDIAKMQKAVKEAKKTADFVIVSMHSGYEYKINPNNRQINFAHSAVDAGADLVIGHHPHIVQKAEVYKNKYIFYSLGNFVFDQRATNTRQAVVIKAIFNKAKLLEIEPQAIFIENFSQPTIIKDETAKSIISRLKLNFEN